MTISELRTGDLVTFVPREGETAEGIVTRVWDKPAGNVYVTIKTECSCPGTRHLDHRLYGKPQTFVRCSSEVWEAFPCQTPALHRACKCSCSDVYWTDTAAAEIAQAARAGA